MRSDNKPIRRRLIALICRTFQLVNVKRPRARARGRAERAAADKTAARETMENSNVIVVRLNVRALFVSCRWQLY